MSDILSASLPISQISNAFSGIFGSKDYSYIKLLNIQMEMLNNISEKIELIQKQIDLLFDKLEEIKALQIEIPDKVVTELYKKDLQSIFLLTDEKIKAYIKERQRNKIKADQKFEKVFDDLLKDIQLARVKIFILYKYLNLPLISTCLHFEIFCMVLSKQPKSLIESALDSYKVWITNCLNSELEDLYHNAIKGQVELIEKSKSLYSYSKCLIESRTEPGGEGTKDNPSYSIHLFKTQINRFSYTTNIELDENQKIAIRPLVENCLINHSLLPARLVKLFDESIEYTFQFERYGNGVFTPTEQIRQYPIKDGFIINESEINIVNQINCSLVNPTNNIPNDTPEITPISQELIFNGQKLILFASLVNIAKQALLAIDKLLEKSENLEIEAIIQFGTKQENFSRIRNLRTQEWIKFIDEKSEAIENEDQRYKIKQLRDQMASLNESSQDIYREYQRLEKEFTEILPADLLFAIAKILEPIGKELEIGIQNILREHEKFIGDLGRNLEKAVQDIGKEGERTLHNIGDLVQSVEGFVENEIKAAWKNLDNVEKRIREGKMIDALWHIGTDHLKSTEDNAAIAFQESSLLASIASAAASIYGAPYGGAAFAAWLTYKQTGSLDAALKTAVITYLTQEANAAAKDIKGVEITDIVKRTLVTSAVGAAAIAASGGGEKQVIEGFLKGASLTLANELYKDMTRLDIEGTPPTYTDPYAKGYMAADDYWHNKYEFSFLNKNGDRVVDITKLSRDITHVGIAEVGYFITEDAIPMRALSQIPFVNDMAYYHDQLCALYGLEGVAVQLTLIPATMLTIAGSDRPIMDQIIAAAKEYKK